MIRKTVLKCIILFITLCIAAWCIMSLYMVAPTNVYYLFIQPEAELLRAKSLDAYYEFLDSQHMLPENFVSADLFPKTWAFLDFSSHRGTQFLCYRYTFGIPDPTGKKPPLQVGIVILHNKAHGNQFVLDYQTDVIGDEPESEPEPKPQKENPNLSPNDFIHSLRSFPSTDSNQRYYKREEVHYQYLAGNLVYTEIDLGDVQIEINTYDVSKEDWEILDAYPDDLLYQLTSLSDDEFHAGLERLSEMLKISRPAVQDSLNIDAEILKQIPHSAFDTVFRIYRGDFMEGFAERQTILQLTEQPYTQKEIYAVANMFGITLWEFDSDGILQKTDLYTGREQTYYKAICNQEKLVKTTGYNIRPTMIFCLDSVIPHDGAMVYFSTDMLVDYIYYKDLETGTTYDLFNAGYMSCAKEVMAYRAAHGDTDPQGALHKLVDLQNGFYKPPVKQPSEGYDTVIVIAVALCCVLVAWSLHRRKNIKAADAIGLPEESTEKGCT